MDRLACWVSFRQDPSAPGQSLIFEVRSGSLSYGFAATKLNRKNGFPGSDRSEPVVSSCVCKRRQAHESHTSDRLLAKVDMVCCRHWWFRFSESFFENNTGVGKNRVAVVCETKLFLYYY